MNKVFRKQQLTPYEADYAQWCAEQDALLWEGPYQIGDVLDQDFFPGEPWLPNQLIRD